MIFRKTLFETIKCIKNLNEKGQKSLWTELTHELSEGGAAYNSTYAQAGHLGFLKYFSLSLISSYTRNIGTVFPAWRVAAKRYAQLRLQPQSLCGLIFLPEDLECLNNIRSQIDSEAAIKWNNFCFRGFLWLCCNYPKAFYWVWQKQYSLQEQWFALAFKTLLFSKIKKEKHFFRCQKKILCVWRS